MICMLSLGEVRGYGSVIASGVRLHLQEGNRMICANYRLRAVTLVAVGGLVLAAVAPVCAWADADDDGAPSRLIAMADFNRDGIADVAVAADSGALTVSLGQANGAFRSMAPGPAVAR